MANGTLCACTHESCAEDVCLTKYMCYRHLASRNGSLEETLGCLTGGKDDIWRFSCNLDKQRLLQSGSSFGCCSGSPLCNEDIELLVPPSANDLNGKAGHQLSDPMLLTLYILLPALALTLLLLLVVIIVIKKRRERKQQCVSGVKTGAKLKAWNTDLQDQALLEDSVSSGSGSGVPLLVQRTVARQIELIDNIGSGRYGQVYRADYRGSHVAVKVFSSREEAAWQHELRVYHTALLRHDGILAFLAADVTCAQSTTQLWLVTQYHAPGSLYDVLRERGVNLQQMLLYCYTAAAGLEHLHAEIHGTVVKPAIAHCDIKSKNVLVKLDGTCCIADLGMALLATDSNLSEGRLGTRRYAAPELLDESCDTSSIQSYLRADVYAFALVMWEVLWRCSVNGRSNDFCPPYWGSVVSEPSVADMRKVVCNGERPPLSPGWKYDPMLRSFSAMMQEAWSQVPSARPSMLRIKKQLKQLLQTSTADSEDKQSSIKDIEIIQAL